MLRIPSALKKYFGVRSSPQIGLVEADIHEVIPLGLEFIPQPDDVIGHEHFFEDIAHELRLSERCTRRESGKLNRGKVLLEGGQALGIRQRLEHFFAAGKDSMEQRERWRKAGIEHMDEVWRKVPEEIKKLELRDGLRLVTPASIYMNARSLFNCSPETIVTQADKADRAANSNVSGAEAADLTSGLSL